jgi:hypothetical protein
VDVLERLREPTNLADPYPFYAELREVRATRTPLGAIALARYGDVTAVFADSRFAKPSMPRTAWKAALAVMRMFLLLDPPDHTRLRRVVAPAFTPSAIGELGPLVNRVAESLVPDGEREIDLVADFAYPFPLAVICELLGVPPSDRPQFAAWSRVITTSLDDPMPTTLKELPRALRSIAARRSHPIATIRALNSMVGYARTALDRALADPPSEIVDRIGRARRAGEIDADEAVATWILLTIAGHETTANLIANGVLALLEQRDALAQVAPRPELLPAAVDELLRFDSPVPHTVRVAGEAVNVAGVDVARGQQVLLLMAAANRDPEAFPHPDQLRFDRPKAPPHVGFAHGIHFCAGAALARLEAEVALNTVLPRLDDRQDLSRARRRPSVAVRGLESFPLRLA